MSRSSRALRIGITQRHLPETSTSFARDALDVAWVDWMATCLPDADWLAIPNFADPDHAIAWLQRWSINSLILSGGDDVGSSPRRDALERALLDHAATRRMAVVGICRGMQMLQLHAGGDIVASDAAVGVVHPVMAGQQTIPVNSWHRNAIRDVAAEWEVLATAPDGSIEAMHHQRLPWLGLMWHPEREHGGGALVEGWIRAAFSTGADDNKNGVMGQVTKALEWDYSALAASYDLRVDYAPDLVDRVLRDIGIAVGDTVVDVGAGTGKLTRLLCDFGADVIALEPNAAMRAVARNKAVVRQARWVAAHGQRIPLPLQALRLVTYGSSFNVMPAQAALDECHRVLRDGGHWLATWNHRDLDDGLQREVEGIIARHLPGYDYGRRRISPEADVLAHGGFHDLQFHQQRFVAELPARAWLDAWRSHATLQRQAGARLPQILGDIDACVGAAETLRIPYFTRIWTAQRCPR